MVQYTWNGNDGSYADPANWTPEGVPLYDGGASALIQSGTVTLSDTEPNDISITLAGTDEATQPNLVLDNAALGPGVFLSLVPPNAADSGFATMTVDGYDTNSGRVFVGVGQGAGPDILTIAVTPYSQLNQEGTVGVYASSKLQVDGTGQGPSTLNNDGTISVAGGSAIISTDVVGSGTIAFLSQTAGFSDAVEFAGSVSATQRISFSDPNFGTKESLRIDSPSAFHGVIDGFTDQLDSITLANTQATRAYFAQITPDSGALLLLNGQEVVGALTVTGAHAANAYGVSSNPDGSVTVAPPGLTPGI